MPVTPPAATRGTLFSQNKAVVKGRWRRSLAVRPTQISLRLVKADSAGFFCCMHTQTLLCELWQGMSMATKGWLVSHEVYLWSAVIVLHLHVKKLFDQH